MTPDERTSITEISDGYVADIVALSPMYATYLGVPGREDALDDLSPDGLAEMDRLAADTLAAAAAATPDGAGDEIARRGAGRAAARWTGTGTTPAGRTAT